MRQHTILGYTCTPPERIDRLQNHPLTHTRKKRIIKLNTRETQRRDSVHFPTLRAPAAQTHAALPFRGAAASSSPRGLSMTPLRCRQGISPLRLPFFLPVWGCSCRALTALWLPWAACTAPDRGVTAPSPRWLVLNTRIRLESRHRALFFLSGGAGEEGGSPPPWGRWVSVRPEPAAAPSLSPTSGCRPRLPPVRISDLPGVMLPLYWFTSLNSATISSYPYQA